MPEPSKDKRCTPPSFSVMRPPPKLRWLVALACFFAGACLAQTRIPGLDAGALAEATLGTLPGVAAGGILRGERMDVAVLRRTDAGAAFSVDDPSQTPEPVFEIGSVTKVLTGLLVAQRVERGELRLDQSLGELLSDRVHLSSEQTQGITLGQLLTHTSCLTTWPSNPARLPVDKQRRYDRPHLWSILGSTIVSRAPPCETRYSNYAYAILGELLAERSQVSWEALVQRDITGRIGMPSTPRPCLAIWSGGWLLHLPKRTARRNGKWTPLQLLEGCAPQQQTCSSSAGNCCKDAEVSSGRRQSAWSLHWHPIAKAHPGWATVCCFPPHPQGCGRTTA